MFRIYKIHNLEANNKKLRYHSNAKTFVTKKDNTARSLAKTAIYHLIYVSFYVLKVSNANTWWQWDISLN